MAGAKVVIEATVAFRREGLISEALDATRAERTIHRREAQFFIIPKPEKLLDLQRTSWACGLRGGYAADMAFFCSGGRKGVCMGHRRFGSTRKCIYMSAGFQAIYGELCALIRACASNWRELDDAGLVRMWTALGGPKRRGELVILVSNQEFKNPRGILAHKNRLLTEDQGRRMVLQHLSSHSRIGYLGR